MSLQKFRIEAKDSNYRRFSLVLLCLMFVISVWLWLPGVIKYQVLIQILMSFVLLLYFVPKIVAKQEKTIFLLEESGRITWLMPQETVSWEISSKSRSTGWWQWLALNQPLSDSSRSIMLFKDSVSDEHWRHLCRVINRRIRA